jgi:hypothetical protein
MLNIITVKNNNNYFFKVRIRANIIFLKLIKVRIKKLNEL